MEHRAAFHYRPMAVAMFGSVFAVLTGAFLSRWLLICLAALSALLFVLCFRRKSRWQMFVLLFSLMLFRMAAVPTVTEQCGVGMVTGRITDLPAFTGEGMQVVLSDVRWQEIRLEGKTELTVSKTAELRYGDRIRVQALAIPKENPYEIGSTGVVYQATAIGDVDILSHSDDPWGFLLRMRVGFHTALEELYGEQAPSAKGILLGDSDALNWEKEEAYRRNGLLHLFAVSGLHISLLTGMLLRFVRFRSNWLRYALMAAFLLFYCSLTEFTPSVLRASFMVLALKYSELNFRQSDAPSAFCFSAVGVLLISPYALYRIGFQLSFSAMLGILLLAPQLRKILPFPDGKVRSALCAAIAAGLGIFPLLAYYFSEIAWVSVPLSVLLIFTVPPLLGLGVLSMCIYGFAPKTAHLLSYVPRGILICFDRVTEWLHIEALTIQPPNLLSILLWYAALVFCSEQYLRNNKRPPYLGFGLGLASLLMWIVL